MVVVVVNFNNPVPFFSDSSSVLLFFFCTIATIKGTGLIKKKEEFWFTVTNSSLTFSQGIYSVGINLVGNIGHVCVFVVLDCFSFIQVSMEMNAALMQEGVV